MIVTIEIVIIWIKRVKKANKKKTTLKINFCYEEI